ncbi:hypothetical protein [Chryseobacterium sp.]|uniref:hypothetical protein n=1 Tax=Chryseobacterium sp. TaxID=1871047 RepID=UPI00388CF7E1
MNYNSLCNQEYWICQPNESVEKEFYTQNCYNHFHTIGTVNPLLLAGAFSVTYITAHAYTPLIAKSCINLQTSKSTGASQPILEKSGIQPIRNVDVPIKIRDNKKKFFLPTLSSDIPIGRNMIEFIL